MVVDYQKTALLCPGQASQKVGMCYDIYNNNSFAKEHIDLANDILGYDIKNITPYSTVIVAIMLVSKVPTLSLKKISISPKTTVFLLLTIGIIFIALLFYTLESLLIFGVIYLLSIPASIVAYKIQNKKNLKKISHEDHEDVL